MSTTNPAFVVSVECRNCGGVFEREYEPRTKVANKHDGVYTHHIDCNDFMCDCCGRLKCPTCELRKQLTIDEREPLDDSHGSE